jgi:hypothetical protein
MMPTDPAPEPVQPHFTEPGLASVPARGAVYHWYHRLFAVLLATLCLVIGIFLLLFPWTQYWNDNYFVHLVPSLRSWWSNLYVRGAVSGIGVVNLYISLVDVFRLKRFSQH